MLTTLTIEFNGNYIDANVRRDFVNYIDDSKYLVIVEPFGKFKQPTVFSCFRDQFMSVIDYITDCVNRPFEPEYKAIISYKETIEDENEGINLRAL